MTTPFDPDSLPDLELAEDGKAVPVTKAEETLLRGIDQPTLNTISIGNEVEDAEVWGENQAIRGPFLRHICLNAGLYKVDPIGLNVSGALICGQLNLELGVLSCGIMIKASRFVRVPDFTHCKIPLLNLSHSYLPGMHADGLNVKSGVFLRDTIVEGNIRLLGAYIAGNLECDGARFEGEFSAERLTVKGRVFWRSFEDTSQMSVVWADSRVGDYFDDGSGWPIASKLDIDGFVYEKWGHHAPASKLRTWLQLMPKVDEDETPTFCPQPYEQMIKTLRASGHERDARHIAIAKQDAYREYLRAKAQVRQTNDNGEKVEAYVPGEGRFLYRFWLWFIGKTIGYGYTSWRAIGYLFAILIIGTYIFSAINENGLMEPAKERIYTHTCYVDPSECKHWLPIKHVSTKGETRYAPPDYPDFNAFVYSLDVLVPIVDLKLENHWMPSSQSMWGRFYFWLHIALGWIFTTIAVAGFTGLIKKD